VLIFSYQFRCVELDRENVALRGRLAEPRSPDRNPKLPMQSQTHLLESEIITLQRNITEAKQELLGKEVYTRELQSVSVHTCLRCHIMETRRTMNPRYLV
jgi:hypothetical protein